jgi:hypothetical protein
LSLGREARSYAANVVVLGVHVDLAAVCDVPCDGRSDSLNDVRAGHLRDHAQPSSAVRTDRQIDCECSPEWYVTVPVIAHTASHYGIAPEVIARASLIGQPVHALSPLLAPVYLVCGLIGVDVADAQRFALKWAILVSCVVLVAAIVTDAIPFSSGAMPGAVHARW